jgi:hypothetical protein
MRRSTGSEHDPLPIGDWKVTGVRESKFHYNPNSSGRRTDGYKATIPGPESPVGVVWVDIAAAHYGLHGARAVPSARRRRRMRAVDQLGRRSSRGWSARNKVIFAE